MILTSDGKICRNTDRDQADSTHCQQEQPEATTATTGEGLAAESNPPVGAVFASDSPLVYAPYQHNPLPERDRCPQISCQNPLAKGGLIPDQITIHEHGFSVQCGRWNEGNQPDHLVDVERGKIDGFSSKSARRLRQHMLTQWGGKDSHPFAVTLTTRQIHTPERWESALKRFRTTLARKHPDWAACWRVELQKRKTPHLHCVFWFPEVKHVTWVQYHLTELWLKAIGEDEDQHSWTHAVSVKDLTGATGWVIYCTLHDSKHKKDQLGWKGRQWGIWNKKAWEARPALTETRFTPEQRVTLCRRLRKHSRNRIPGKRSKPLRFYSTRNISAFCMDASILRQILRGIE
jgi:hypothetical protein